MSLEPRFATVDGVKMRYFEAGSSDPAVLLLHGVPACAHLWRNVVPLVSAHARTVAIDFVGMGGSDKPRDRKYDLPSFTRFLDAAIAELHLDKFVLAGMDLGLIVGLHWAMAHPEAVRGLVLMEGFIAPVGTQMATFPGVNQFFMWLMRYRPMAERGIARDPLAVDRFIQSGVVRKLSEEDLAVYREAMSDPEIRRKVWVEGIGPHQLRPKSEQPGDLTDLIDRYAAKLARSPVPKLLVYGEPGAAVSAPMREWAKEHLQNLEMVSVGPGKHFLPEDQPEAVGKAIASFVARLR